MTGRAWIAPAKINLALHVRHRRGDGYHEIDTLFAFAEDGDVLTVSPADDLSLEITGPFAEALPIAGNLVLRAAEALRRHGAGPGARIMLDKRLPVASGIGGGSADAAAALRALIALWRMEIAPDALSALALSLGADVPACLHGVTCRGEGVGDRLTPVDPGVLAGMPLLLVNPGVALSTAAVFARWDGIDRGPLDRGDAFAAMRAGRNDLAPAAIASAPVVAEVLAALGRQPGARLVRMSGSGATCFALYGEANARDAAAATIARSHPDWWTLSTRLR